MRWVVYVDMDAYYVACERRRRPELVGKAVIVGPPPHLGVFRGVVLSASYEARAFGVHSAMPAEEAARRAPEAIWLPPDFAWYEATAREWHGVVRRFDERFQPRGIDEGSLAIDRSSPEEVRDVAQTIQRAIRDELGLSCSIGAAPDPVVAKIASDQAKPGGIRVVPPEEIRSFLAPLSVRAIPGIGPKTEAALRAIGCRTIADIARCDPIALRRIVGSGSRALRQLALGRPMPEAPAPDPSAPRSRSVDRTFDQDQTESAEVVAHATELATRLARELRSDGWQFGTVAVQFTWADFSQTSRRHTLPAAADGTATLAHEAGRLAQRLWTEGPPGQRRRVRTISVRAESLRRRRPGQRTLDGKAP